MKSRSVPAALLVVLLSTSGSLAAPYSGDFQCTATNYSEPVYYVRQGTLAIFVHGVNTKLETESVMACSGNTCYSLGGDPNLFQHTTIIEVFSDEKGTFTAKNTFVVYPKGADRGGVTVTFETWECSR